MLASVFVRKPAVRTMRPKRDAVLLQICDACALAGELVARSIPNPKPVGDRAAGEPEKFTIHVHPKRCESARRLAAALRYVSGVRHG